MKEKEKEKDKNKTLGEALASPEKKQAFVMEMFNRIAKRYDLMNTILTFGLDRRWRKKALRALGQSLVLNQSLNQAPGKSSSEDYGDTNKNKTKTPVVADFACGTSDFIINGDFILRNKKVGGRSSEKNKFSDISLEGLNFVGVDFSKNMLEIAKTRIEKRAWKKKRGGETKQQPKINADLICADLLKLPIANKSFDGAVMGFALRNLTDIDAALVEIGRTLKSGAILCLLEVGIPKKHIIKFLHRLYFGQVVPLIGGMLSDKKAYKYLPQSVEFLPTEEELKAGLERAGFFNVMTRPMTFNSGTLTTAIMQKT